MQHRKRVHTSAKLVAVLMAGALVAAACGDDDDGSSSDGETTEAPSGTEASGDTEAPSDTGTAATEAPSDTGTAATEAPSDTGTAATEAPDDSAAPSTDGFTDEEYMRLVGTTDVPDYVRASVDRGAATLTDEQVATALEIWQNGGGETGSGGELNIAYTDGFGGNTWRRIAWMEFVLQAMTYPEVGEVVYSTANGDPQVAISNIESHIAQGVDAMVVYADAGDTLQPVAEEAQAAGIVVTSFISPPGAATDTYVSYDICKVGTGMATTTVEATGGEGNVVLLGGTPGNPYTATWEECAREEYAKHPGINIVGRADTNWTPEGAFEAASSFLAQEEDIAAWNYDYASAASQIYRAYETADRDPDFSLSTGGDDQGPFCLIDELKADHPGLRGFFGLGGPWLSRIALSAAVDTINGEGPGATVDVPFEYQEYVDTCDTSLPDDTPQSRVLPDDVLVQMLG